MNYSGNEISSEYRLDPLTKRRVIVARGRSQRPYDNHGSNSSSTNMEAMEQPTIKANCPFCVSNEGMTPPEVAAIRTDSPPDSPGWDIRVVPNKYPALQPLESAAPTGEGSSRESMGWFASSPAQGAHEVVIHDPDHSKGLLDLGVEKLARVLGVYRDRFRHFAAQKELTYAVAVVNHGAEAGASLEHSHSQLFATTNVPLDVASEVSIAEADYQAGRECRMCSLIQQEIKREVRVLGVTQTHISFVQYASRSPYQVTVAPLKHQQRFEQIADSEVEGLAEVVWRSHKALNGVMGSRPYNLVLRSSPWGSHESQGYHWKLDIIPKLSIMAGFELGTGVFINVVPPEEAAAELRPHF